MKGADQGQNKTGKVAREKAFRTIGVRERGDM
jgi:hypothetical protein